MIQKVIITNPKGEALELELSNPEKSGLAVANIEGLGPPKANINGVELATSDGMLYSSARAATRNITFTLVMYAREIDSPFGYLSVEESRHLTYGYFPLKKKIRMTFVTDVRTVYADGYVESNEPVIFSQQEYATISVICPDPYLYEEGEKKTTFSGIQPGFEFPFSNESLTEPLIEFGTIWKYTETVLTYRGTVDSGVLITIHNRADTSKNINIYNVDTTEYISIDTDRIEVITGEKYGLGDDIIISTVRGDRYCRLLKEGKYYNIIGCLSRDSDWLQLTNGRNVFAFTAEEGADKLSVTFSYNNAYVGV